MNHKRQPVYSGQKEKIRAEIEAHVREYLRKGGQIDEVTAAQRPQVRAIGETWSRLFDEGFRGHELPRDLR